jgi:hypothetical protein
VVGHGAGGVASTSMRRRDPSTTRRRSSATRPWRRRAHEGRGLPGGQAAARRSGGGSGVGASRPGQVKRSPLSHPQRVVRGARRRNRSGISHSQGDFSRLKRIFRPRSVSW